MDDVRIAPKVEHPKCPYCHEAVKASDDKAPCLACMAWQHRACRVEHGRCAACGAAGEAPDGERASERAAEAPAPWWRASGPPPPAGPLRLAAPPVTPRVEPAFGEQPALPPPEQRHRPIGAWGLFVYVAWLTALAAVVMLLAM